MRPRHWTILFAATVVFVFTPSAFAWGPATHVELGSELLKMLSLLPPAIAAIIARHRSAYLYGNVAADVVFAKRLSRVKQFCHHWSTGFRIVDSARTDDDKAFAFGYLSHLAADTVAHNKFVPYQVLISRMPVNVGHFYWELRADGCSDQTALTSLRETLEIDQTAHHEAMRPHLTGTFLTHNLNRVVFQRINYLTTRESFRHAMDVHGRFAKFPLAPSLLAAYRGECVDRILSVLREGPQSAVLREDPNGTTALMKLTVRTRELRRLRRRGVPTGPRVFEAASGFRPEPNGYARSLAAVGAALTGTAQRCAL